MKIILDTCGGDNSSYAAIDGAIAFLKTHNDVTVILTGDENAIKTELDKRDYKQGDNLRILHAPDVISCDEQPTAAIKEKPNSSMMVAIRALAADEADAMVSSGSTGALLVAGVLKVKRIKGVIRPALTPLLPNLNDSHTLLVDSGANADCQPEYLVQFAIMGTLYMKAIMGIENPKVALISNGTEAEKGNELTHEAYALLSRTPGINFMGNCEARDVLAGKYDICVCDGFTGNILLKASEGAIKAFSTVLAQEITSSTVSKIGALLIHKKLRNIKKRFDYREAGGAPLLGIRKCIIKAHGSSDQKAFRNALEQAYTFVNNDVIGLILKAVAETAEQ